VNKANFTDWISISRNRRASTDIANLFRIVT